MSDVQDRRLQVNGVSLGIEIREAKRVDGQIERPTLVLLHGFTGSIRTWEQHSDVFAQARFRVIALDMLGHGRSDIPEDPRRYSIEHSCEDILAALRLLNVREGEAILLGYSMGGRIALYTAFTGFFRALILESASPGIQDAEARYKRQRADEALASYIEREGIHEFVELWENIALFESQKQLPPEIRANVRAQRLANSETGLANSLRGVGQGVQPSLSDRLPELKLPVLLITGELDNKFRGIAQEMATLLPNAHVEVVPGAGHTVHLERPEQFDTLVLDFCTSVGA